MDGLFWWILGVLVGISIMILVEILITKRHAIGVLKINLKDPNADVYRFVIDSDVDGLLKKKFVVIKVESQK